MRKIVLPLLIFVFLAPFGFASEIERLPLTELPDRSTVIVLGEVIKVIPQDNDNLDRITITIQAVLKGELHDDEATFMLSSRGGLKDFDPQLKAGDIGVFFLINKNNTFTKAYWGSIAIFSKNNFSTSACAYAQDAIAEVFPRISLRSKPATLSLIAEYGAEQAWTLLQKNTLRIVVQPMGIISEAYEIDLETGNVIAFPATHQKTPKSAFTLSRSAQEELRLILTSDEFRSLTPQNKNTGLDGTFYFIEVDLDGRYQWLLHWQTDQQIITTVIRIISNAYKNTNKSK